MARGDSPAISTRVWWAAFCIDGVENRGSRDEAEALKRLQAKQKPKARIGCSVSPSSSRRKHDRLTVKELCELQCNEVNFDATCALRVKSRLTRPWTLIRR